MADAKEDAAASSRGCVLRDSSGFPADESWDGCDYNFPMSSPEIDVMEFPNGTDIVARLDRDVQEAADEEDQENTIADAVAEAMEAVAAEEGAASGAASSRVADDEQEAVSGGRDDEQGAPTRKKMRSAEAEAGPAEAAPAVASTSGPARREAMKSRIVVQQGHSSEKFSLVCAADQMVAEIDRVLAAREDAIWHEARDSYGASTREEGRKRLVQARRACVVTASRGHLDYFVIDAQLQKRSKYYIFRAWAKTRDGKWHLQKRDSDGQWQPLPLKSDSGAWTIPKEARTCFKNHADRIFGGQTWLDVLSQMGGCPSEFVDCWIMTIDQRLQAAISPRLVCHAGASTPSS